MISRSRVRSSFRMSRSSRCRPRNERLPARAKRLTSKQPAASRSIASLWPYRKVRRMALTDTGSMPEIVTEAIVVIDLVESTLTSNLFGWYAVGRHSLRDLRSLIGEIGKIRGLRCLRSTGDGYLLTFYDPQSAEMAAIRAVEAVFELLRRILTRNQEVSEERALNLRCAVHLGEVDVVANDREGPHVSMAFRLQEISRASLPAALNPVSPEEFPLKNYVLCSE